MNIPKFIRRWVYKRMLKELDRKGKYTYLCHFCKYQFPYIKIEHYPELWNRRFVLSAYNPDEPPHAQVWFFEESTRRVYVLQAIALTTPNSL